MNRWHPPGRGTCLRLLAALWALVASLPAHATAPLIVTQQGRLFAGDGLPVTGTETIVFALYTQETGGFPVWFETDEVEIIDGYFSVDLGAVTPLDGIFDGSAFYLGVKVGTDPEMTPRGLVGWVVAAASAIDATGDIHPLTVSIGGSEVIDATGHWVGPFTSLSYAASLASNTLGGGQCEFDASEGAGLGGLLCEGSASDAFETLLTVANPTADRTITLPDESGTVCTTGSICSGYQSAATALTTSVAWSGDLSGTGASPTVAPNAVALTTDTTGNYVQSLASGTGLSGGAAGSEGAILTLSLSYANQLNANALTSGQCVFDSADNAGKGGILFEGVGVDGIETLLTVNEPVGGDNVIALPSESGTVCTTGSICSGYQPSATALVTSTAWGGDLTGTGASPTVAANAVALGTDTVGNYVQSLATGLGLTGGAAGSEGAVLTLALAYGDRLNSNSLTAGQSIFDSQDNGGKGGIIFEGASVDGIETLLTVIEPTAGDNTIALPSENGTICTTGSICAGYQASATALTTSTAWGGDLSGTGTAPTVQKINGATLGTATPTSGNLLIGSGAAWVTQDVDGDVTMSAAGIDGSKIRPVFGKSPTSGYASLNDNPLGANTTTINVASTTGFAASGGTLRLENELVTYTSTNGTQFLGVTRGRYGTSSSSHPYLVQVVPVLEMSVLDVSVAPAWMVQANGLAGLGTSTPDSTLHIKNPGDNGATVRIGGNASALVDKIIRFGDGSGVWIGESSAADDILRLHATTATYIDGDGTASAPILTFGSAADPNTGLFHPSADTLGLTAGGIERLRAGSMVAMTLSATASTTALCSSLANASAPSAGVLYEIRDCSNTPAADYAENYPMAADVVAGDLVTLGEIEVTTTDGDHLRQLVKATAPYARGLVGVVSDPTKATDFNVIGYNIREADHPLPLALNGRVAAILSTENGAIAPGDPITASTVPGIGMKATAPGMIVGFALDAFSAKTPGHVLVFVNPGWWDDDGASTTCSRSRDGAITRTERGIEVTADVVAIRDDSLAGTTTTGTTNTTGTTGLATVMFAHALGYAKPVVALTVEGAELAFVQIARFIRDADGRYTGFEIKSFAPSGAALGGVTLHYLVIAKETAPPAEPD